MEDAVFGMYVNKFDENKYSQKTKIATIIEN